MPDFPVPRKESESVGDANQSGQEKQSVLIVDDEPGMLSFLERALESKYERVVCASSAEEGQALLSKTYFDVLVLDISLPGMSGLKWLQMLRDGGYPGDVVLITGYADMETAINALRAGAQDFLQKPFRLDQLWNALKRASDRSRLLRENFILKRTVRQMSVSSRSLVGESAQTRQLRKVLERVGQTQATVMLAGESGVGKEVAARFLHDISPRASHSFVPVNCAAIASELMESELFGHAKGAFTGATEHHQGLFYYAQSGTLFLDEIGELPLAMQTKLLRVLEERKVRPVGSVREFDVNVRIIAATNRDLKIEVDRGRFRQDLYYRLNVMPIEIPPLRARVEDILPLTLHFIEQLSSKLGLEVPELGKDVLNRMMAYDWPGNIRELRNFIERSLIMGYFPVESLPVIWPDEGETDTPGSDVPKQSENLEEIEKRHILKILAETQGNKSEAARRLGVSRKTLERKCALWNQSDI
jgi:DNA-binding NtrC family response regulator